jgi:hypothetical protein
VGGSGDLGTIGPPGQGVGGRRALRWERGHPGRRLGTWGPGDHRALRWGRGHLGQGLGTVGVAGTGTRGPSGPAVGTVGPCAHGSPRRCSSSPRSRGARPRPPAAARGWPPTGIRTRSPAPARSRRNRSRTTPRLAPSPCPRPQDRARAGEQNPADAFPVKCGKERWRIAARGQPRQKASETPSKAAACGAICPRSAPGQSTNPYPKNNPSQKGWGMAQGEALSSSPSTATIIINTNKITNVCGAGAEVPPD